MQSALKRAPHTEPYADPAAAFILKLSTIAYAIGFNLHQSRQVYWLLAFSHSTLRKTFAWHFLLCCNTAQSAEEDAYSLVYIK